MKKIIKNCLLAVLAFIALAFVMLVIWYQIDGQPLPQARDYLTGENFTSKKINNGDWLFTPKAPNGVGVAIMHGALIKPESYAKTAAFFAARGYRVWIPQGQLRLSILSADRIAAELKTMPEQDWIFIGHSMGGLTALQVHSLLNQEQAKVKGIAVWAGSMPKDFSSVKLPMLFLSGSADKMLPAEKLELAKAYLPKETMFISVAGANHKNFALYSHQFFDGTATIEHDQQIDQAHALTLPFVEKLTQH